MPGALRLFGATPAGEPEAGTGVRVAEAAAALALRYPADAGIDAVADSLRSVIRLMLELFAAPAMVAGSTLACRRWGAHIGGLLSAFPAVIGPVLLIAVMQRGERYTVRVATGTLLGLVALSAFAVAYATVAGRARWGTSLAAGWVSAALLAAVMGLVGDGVKVPVAFAAATIALGCARLAMPAGGRNQTGYAPPGAAAGDLTMRMIVTALLVVVTTAAEGLAGPLVGGMLAGLPVLASVLAVFTHRRAGPAALRDLLRGMLTGMAGFVGFCVVVALLIVPAGTAVAFVLATLVAVAVQILTVKKSRIERWAAQPGVD